MIRLITPRRLESLLEETHKARLRAAEIRAQAERSLLARIHEVWDLTVRAEAAESEVAKLRRALEEKPAVVGRWLLLHYGQPHSIHRTLQAAKERAVMHGAASDGWRPSSAARPAAEDTWRTVPVMVKEGHDAFLPS
ncbi:hypothetical protein J1792_08470 [Streptomyces triculaminicus]|uniref:Uncharacterized protein n=1 Tax=Streptomyces triculaminicus TaxID=2816232 RepID=A0A939FLA9_9ACTN|nr:hypothetical protein [Streptomyces triculaminicus]MBO0652819.1 hypothetical protein [Streptomyces triculaminicus]